MLNKKGPFEGACRPVVQQRDYAMVVCGGDAAISQITLNTFKQHGECLHERNPKTLFFKLTTIFKIKFAPGSAFADHCTYVRV